MITLSSPVIERKEVLRPETEVRVFNSMWITRMQVVSHPAWPTSIEVEFRPWSSENNSLSSLEDQTKILRIENLFAEAEEDPSLAQAIGRLIQELERQACKRGVLS